MEAATSSPVSREIITISAKNPPIPSTFDRRAPDAVDQTQRPHSRLEQAPTHHGSLPTDCNVRRRTLSRVFVRSLALSVRDPARRSRGRAPRRGRVHVHHSWVRDGQSGHRGDGRRCNTCKHAPRRPDVVAALLEGRRPHDDTAPSGQDPPSPHRTWFSTQPGDGSPNYLKRGWYRSNTTAQPPRRAPERHFGVTTSVTLSSSRSRWLLLHIHSLETAAKPPQGLVAEGNRATPSQPRRRDGHVGVGRDEE